MRMISMPIIWLLDEALVLVQLLQPQSRIYGYHLAMGGGVLNTGYSCKDLDLYFLPLDNVDDTPDVEGLKRWLEGVFGTSEPISDPEYGGETSAYAAKWKFVNMGKRVDVFVGKGE